MRTSSLHTEVRVGPQGRFTIPAPLRKLLGIRAGDRLVVRSAEGQLILEKPEAVIARVHDRFRSIPSSVSLADELIAERREEARREADR